MKYFILSICTVLLSAAVFAQSPDKMSYQSVVRDAGGELVSSTTVGVQLSILQGGSSGTPVYVETHAPSTNVNGLFSVQLGSGVVVSGAISSIDWASGPFFLKTETDPNGGSDYTITGSSELLSVPYALYAANGGTPGPQGPQGPQGAQGPQGPAGEQGATGAQGPSGADGADGTGVVIIGSVASLAALPVSYSGDVGDMFIAQDSGDGYVWDGSGWVNVGQIQGPAGPQGPTGAQGSTGSAGPQGNPGPQGPMGDTGAQGPQGNPGPQGPMGDTGPQGPMGNANISGTTNQIIKFTGANTGGDSQITDNGTNVGIGTTTPFSTLHVKTSSSQQMRIESTTPGNDSKLSFWTDEGIKGIVGYSAFNNTMFLATTGDDDISLGTSNLTQEIMRLQDGTGNVGIGTTTPSNKLDVNGKITLSQSSDDEMVLINDNTWEHFNGSQNFGNGGDHFIMASRESSIESAGVYGDGNSITLWSPGDSNGGQPFAYIYVLDEDAYGQGTTTDPYDGNALQAYLNTSGLWVAASDRNRKENIVPLVSSLDKILQIQAYSYDFKQSTEEKAKGSPQSNAIGVIAQEVEPIIPEVVEKSEGGDYYVSYIEFIPFLIESIKEQQTQIDDLKKELETLKKETR